MNTEKTGELIRELRAQKGWSQDKLGELVGVSERTIGNWERGLVSNIKMGNIERLASVFEVSELDIMMGEINTDIDPKIKAELVESIKEMTEITITLEDRGITSLDVGISAFGLAVIAFALAMWAAFPHNIILTIICSLLGIFGAVFIAAGRKIIKRMEERLKDRKASTSVS